MSSIKNLNILILTIVLCAYGYALPYSNGNSGSDQSSSAKVNYPGSNGGIIATHNSNSKRSIDLNAGFDRQSANNDNKNNVYINNGDGTIKMLNNVEPLSSYNSGAYNTHAEKRNIDSQRLAINDVNQQENNILPADDRRRVVPTLSTTAEQNSGRTIPFSSTSSGSTNLNINSVTGLHREAIIFPDTLPKQTPKDSYGNPVTPYSVLPEEPSTRPTNSAVIDVGHKTDVNRDGGISNVDNKKEVIIKTEKDNFAFILPSYASGIMKLETYSDGHVPVRISDIQKPPTDLLPPLSSGNFNYPEIYKESTKKPTQTSSTTSNTQKPININPPSDTLVPPPPAQPVNSFNFNQGRETTTTPRPTSYQAIQPTISQFIQPPNNNQSPPQQNYPTTQNQVQTNPTQSTQFLFPPRPGSPPNFQSQPAPPSTQNSQQIPTQPTFLQPPNQPPPQVFQSTQQRVPTQPENSASKYTGSFGGAPGFLTPYNKPIIPPPTQLTSAPTVPSTQSTITTTYSSSTTSRQPQTTVAVQGIPFSNRFADTAPQGNPQPSPPAAPPRDTSQDKYTGGFGGPPGILSPFDARPTSG